MAAETERRRSIERQGIVQALSRLDEGEYSCCVQCGEPVPLGRLRLDPTVPKVFQENVGFYRTY